ncbi:MAG: amidohydrolase family protein [Clostridia bacterium]|nr:amidohydrolase family protein [Clostridia bacterium]
MIGENVLRGEPFKGVFIFDIHAHIDATSDFELTDSSPDKVVRTLDALGIGGACVSSILSIHADCPLGNLHVKEACSKYPGRLYGYLTVSPYDPDTDLDGAFADPHFKGMKVHAAFHRTAINDPRYEPYWEYADKKRLPVLFHAWELADVRHIAELAPRYPDAKFIIGHGAMRTWAIKREVVKAVKHNGNIFADTTVSVAYDGAIEWAASQLGADRVCYGSDIPFYDCRHVVGKVATSRLSDADKEKILGENAKKILDLP